MSILNVRTTRYHKRDHKTLFKDYIIRKNQDNSIDQTTVQTFTDYKNTQQPLQDHIEQKNQTFPNPQRAIASFSADMEESQDFTYCEIEIRSFAQNKRIDKEFKINLDKSDSYSQFAKIKRFFDLFFDPNKQIESLKIGSNSIDIEFNDNQLMQIDTQEIINKAKDQIDNLVETAMSTVQDKLSDNISSISQRSTKKRKNFLQKIFRK